MTQPAPAEPPPPQRGQTRGERGRDVSAAQSEAEAEISKVRQYLKVMNEVLVVHGRGLSGGAQAVHPVLPDPHLARMGVHRGRRRRAAPAVLRDHLPILWVLFWPVRNHQKKNHPEDYAASQQK